MKYKRVSKRLQSLTESKTRCNACSCFWRTSLLYPTSWWCKVQTIEKLLSDFLTLTC